MYLQEEEKVGNRIEKCEFCPWNRVSIAKLANKWRKVWHNSHLLKQGSHIKLNEQTWKGNIGDYEEPEVYREDIKRSG